MRRGFALVLVWSWACTTAGLRLQLGLRANHRARHPRLDSGPRMQGGGDDTPPLLTNPLKVLATVIAQAEIVGVEAPTRVPNSFKPAHPSPAASTTTTATATAGVATTGAKASVTVGGRKLVVPVWECSEGSESEGAGDDRSLLPSGARREIDRDCLHPLLRLGDAPALEAALSSLLSLPTPIALCLAAPLLMGLAPVVLALVAQRKAQWARDVAASAAEHRAAFDETCAAHRDQQRHAVRR